MGRAGRPQRLDPRVVRSVGPLKRRRRNGLGRSARRHQCGTRGGADQGDPHPHRDRPRCRVWAAGLDPHPGTWVTARSVHEGSVPCVKTATGSLRSSPR
jgi:hypothetical protein